MLIVFFGGLLLTAVLHDAHGYPAGDNYFRPSFGDGRPFNSMAAISDEGMPSLEWYNPWLLLGSGYRPYRSPHFYSPFNNELFWPASGEAESTAEARDPGSNNHASADRLLTNDDNRNTVDKRDSYLSMCHFKICNLGRKRRIAQTSSSSSASSAGLRR